MLVLVINSFWSWCTLFRQIFGQYLCNIWAHFVHNLRNICAQFVQYLCTLHNALHIVPTDICAIQSVRSNTSQNLGRTFSENLFSQVMVIRPFLAKVDFCQKGSTSYSNIWQCCQVIKCTQFREGAEKKETKEKAKEAIIWEGYSGSKVAMTDKWYLSNISRNISRSIDSFVVGHWQWHRCYICCIQQQKWDLFCRGVKSVRKER